MPSLTYTTNIPNPPNAPAVDVPNMQTNTNSINTIWQSDHFTFADANPGLHKQVQIAEQIGVPSGLQAGFDTLYTNSVTYASVPLTEGELFFTRGNSGVPIQMTGPFQPTAMTNGYTFLPGGILIQWGFNPVTSTNVTITFPQKFPNALFYVTAQPYGTLSNFTGVYYGTNGGNTTGFQFKITSTAGFTGFGWLAIGN